MSTAAVVGPGRLRTSVRPCAGASRTGAAARRAGEGRSHGTRARRCRHGHGPKPAGRRRAPAAAASTATTLSAVGQLLAVGRQRHHIRDAGACTGAGRAGASMTGSAGAAAAGGAGLGADAFGARARPVAIDRDRAHDAARKCREAQADERALGQRYPAGPAGPTDLGGHARPAVRAALRARRASSTLAAASVKPAASAAPSAPFQREASS